MSFNSSCYLSPIKRVYCQNPLGNEDLPKDVEIYKAEKGLLVMRAGNRVVKWSKDGKINNEFKIHCDDVGDLKCVIPILYGKTGETSSSLPSVFGHRLQKNNKAYFESLAKQINQKAQQKIINESFQFCGEEAVHTLMVYPKLDGTLLDLIPKLLFHGRDDLIEKINDFIKTAIIEIGNQGVRHGDLRPRNVFFKIVENKLEIYLADFGKANRVSFDQALKPEFAAFQSAIDAIRKSRKGEAEWTTETIDWEQLNLRYHQVQLPPESNESAEAEELLPAPAESGRRAKRSRQLFAQ